MNPTPVPTPRLTEALPTPEPTFLIYHVKAGDVLEKIAKRYKTTVASIGYWNRARYKTLVRQRRLRTRHRSGWLGSCGRPRRPTTDTDYEDPTPIPPPKSPRMPAGSPSASPSA